MFTAANNPRGKSALVIELGQAGIWQLFTSASALEEARRNISRKFPECLVRLNEQTRGLRLAPNPSDTPCPEGLPEKDRPIYRTAHACKADVLLTGDRRDFAS